MLKKLNDVIFQCLWRHSCQFKVQNFSKFFWLGLVLPTLKKVPPPMLWATPKRNSKHYFTLTCRFRRRPLKVRFASYASSTNSSVTIVAGEFDDRSLTKVFNSTNTLHSSMIWSAYFTTLAGSFNWAKVFNKFLVFLMNWLMSCCWK